MESKDYYRIYRERLESLCLREPGRNAVYYMKEDGSRELWSYRDFLDGLAAADELLNSIGTVRGDRIAVISPHSPYSVITGMGIAYSGRTSVYIDSSLPADELQERLESADAAALFISEETALGISPVFGEIILKYPVIFLDRGRGKGAHFAFAEGSLKKSRRSDIQDQDGSVISILFSSGTTGRTKGVMITYKSIVEALPMFSVMGRTKDHSSYMCLFPFNHVSGFSGAMVNFMNGHELGMIEKPEPSKYIKAFTEFNPVNISLVAGVYELFKKKIENEYGRSAVFRLKLGISDLLRKKFGLNIGKWMFRKVRKKYFGSRLEFIGMGGGPVSPGLAGFYYDLGVNFENVYSSTELGFAAVVAGVNDRFPIGNEGNVFQFKNINVRVVGKDCDGTGEVRVISPLIMKGYFREPRLTANAFDSCGYFRTGDLGYIDKKGYLHLTGRAKDSIMLRTGKKTSAEDIDRYYGRKLALRDDLGFSAALASRGVRGGSGYDNVHLFIEGEGLSDSERGRILKAVREESVKAPDIYKIYRVHIIDKLPRTQIGKLQRFKLSAPEDDNTAAPNLPGKAADAEKSGSEGSTGFGVLEEALRRVLRGRADINLDDKTELYYDLGMDSLDLYELCVILEEKTGRALEDSMHSRITAGEIRNLLSSDIQISADNYFDVSEYPVKRSTRLDNKLSRFIRMVRMAYSLSVKGAENVPEGSCIICSNHQSFFDCLFMLSAIGESRFRKDRLVTLVASSAQEKNTEQCNMVGSIPLDRGGNTAPAIKRVRQCLKDGYKAIIFPEGRMSDDGSIGEFKPGAAQLAIETGRPILPVRIDGAFNVFPKTKKRPNIFDGSRLKRYKVGVTIGEAISSGNKSADQLIGEVRRSIVGLRASDSV